MTIAFSPSPLLTLNYLDLLVVHSICLPPLELPLPLPPPITAFSQRGLPNWGALIFSFIPILLRGYTSLVPDRHVNIQFQDWFRINPPPTCTLLSHNLPGRARMSESSLSSTEVSRPTLVNLFRRSALTAFMVSTWTYLPPRKRRAPTKLVTIGPYHSSIANVKS
jgi:hypothetical protein